MHAAHACASHAPHAEYDTREQMSSCSHTNSLLELHVFSNAQATQVTLERHTLPLSKKERGVIIKVAIILCPPQESDLLISDGICMIYSKIKAEYFFSMSF